jgi:hypothetical protein
MFLKNLVQLPFRFPFFGSPCSDSTFGTSVSTKIGSSAPSEVTFYFPFSDVECRRVGKFFGVVTISKLFTVPFDKGTSTNALDVLLGFEDSGESIVEKKTKFETYWRCQWCHHCANKQLNKLLLFQATTLTNVVVDSL